MKDKLFWCGMFYIVIGAIYVAAAMRNHKRYAEVPMYKVRSAKRR